MNIHNTIHTMNMRNTIYNQLHNIIHTLIYQTSEKFFSYTGL